MAKLQGRTGAVKLKWVVPRRMEGQVAMIFLTRFLPFYIEKPEVRGRSVRR